LAYFVGLISTSTYCNVGYSHSSCCIMKIGEMEKTHKEIIQVEQ
jgi:hypothetical protein